MFLFSLVLPATSVSCEPNTGVQVGDPQTGTSSSAFLAEPGKGWNWGASLPATMLDAATFVSREAPICSMKSIAQQASCGLMDLTFAITVFCRFASVDKFLVQLFTGLRAGFGVLDRALLLTKGSV